MTKKSTTKRRTNNGLRPIRSRLDRQTARVIKLEQRVFALENTLKQLGRLSVLNPASKAGEERT